MSDFNGKLCDPTSWSSIVYALCMTYFPFVVYSCRISPNWTQTWLHLLAWVMLTYMLAMMGYAHFTNNVKYLWIAIGTFWFIIICWQLATLIWIRIRLCRAGAKYVLAPSAFVETEEGSRIKMKTLETAQGAVVVRKPGATTVNGMLVPSLTNIFSRGRKLAKLGSGYIAHYAAR